MNMCMLTAPRVFGISTTVNMLFCMPTMVLLDQNPLKGSVVNVDRFLLFTIHMQKKPRHDHFRFLLLHFKAPMPKCSSRAQIGMENLGHYAHKKPRLSKSKNKENHDASYLPAAKLSKHNSALAPRALTTLAHQDMRTLPCEY